MKFSPLIKKIDSGEFAPVYLLHGKEPYFMERIADALSDRVLTDAQKEFNLTTVYGKDTDPQQIVDQAQRAPMMSEHQLIFLKEAQDMRQLKDLAAYAKNPTPSTILVLIHKHKRLDMRTKLAKAIKQNGIVFESKPVYDNKLPGWIIRYGRDQGYNIEKKSALLIAQYLGADLSKLVNELEKIFVNISSDENIKTGHVQEYIGVSKDFNIFELHDALARKDVLKANRIIKHFNANPKEHPLLRTTAMLYNFFSDSYALSGIARRNQGMNKYQLAQKMGKSKPFFIRNHLKALNNYSGRDIEKILHLLMEYDLRAKGVKNAHISHESLMKELTWQILHLEETADAIPAGRSL